MSFFNKMLARVGVGAAQIDTVLEKNEYHPNEEIKGTIHVEGGNVDQEVGHIYIEVMTQYVQETNNSKSHVNYMISKHTVAENIFVASEQKIEIPFSFILPPQTPLTLGKEKVWLHTGLDIEMSLDPNDQDYIVVRPHPYMAVVIQAAEQLGFQFKSSIVEYASRAPFGVPYIQEIEFYPGTRFREQLTELELMMAFQEDGLQVMVELDRRGHGLSGFFANAFDMDESRTFLKLTAEELDQGTHYVADQLSHLIEQHIR